MYTILIPYLLQKWSIFYFLYFLTFSFLTQIVKAKKFWWFRCKNNACGGEIDFLFVCFLLFEPKIKGVFASNQSSIIGILKFFRFLYFIRINTIS